MQFFISLVKLKLVFRKRTMTKTPYRSETESFFTDKPITVVNVINLSKYFFESESVRAKKLLSTKRFKAIVNIVIKILNILDPLKSKIKHSLYDTVQSYRTKNGSRVNHAPLKRPEPLRQAMFNLYYNTIDSSKRYAKKFTPRRLLRNKIAALQALATFWSARRWIDCTRLRWDNMAVLKIAGKVSLKFFIACSKANQGNRNEGITLMQDGSRLCPVRLFVEFWILCGRPKYGFVFPCLHKKAKFPKSELCDQWLSRRCSGHKLGKKKYTCNGEINGESSFGVYAREANRLGFKQLPTRNTFRRVGCIMAHKLNLTRQQITTTLGWKHDSDMPNHYLQDEMATSKEGLAFKLSEQIRNSDFSFLDDIPMEL